MCGKHPHILTYMLKVVWSTVVPPDYLADTKLRESSMNPERSERIEIPVLPLRDVVVYPHMVIPLFVGREKIYPLPRSRHGS